MYIYNVLYIWFSTVRFPAATGDLGIYPLQIRGDYCILFCLKSTGSFFLFSVNLTVEWFRDWNLTSVLHELTSVLHIKHDVVLFRCRLAKVVILGFLFLCFRSYVCIFWPLILNLRNCSFWVVLLFSQCKSFWFVVWEVTQGPCT